MARIQIASPDFMKFISFSASGNSSRFPKEVFLLISDFNPVGIAPFTREAMLDILFSIRTFQAPK